MNPSPTYLIGSPRLNDIWVDPVAGRDHADGSSRSAAFKSIQAAWKRLKENDASAERGFRFLLCPGVYAVDADGHINLTHRRGTAAAPILLQPADGPHSVQLPPLDIEYCSYVYLQDLKIVSPNLPHIPSSTDNVIHFAECDHILLRGVVGIGEDTPVLPRIVLKANQCSHLYIEDCDFSGATAYVFAYVAVHYGHIVRSKFRRSNFAGLCVKGGSAYQLIAGNEIDDCRIVGIEAGEGTGFPYLVPPWLQYEAYYTKVVNNVICNSGNGVCIGGGYNILVAFNTLYRVGACRDALIVALGTHGWVDGAAAVCEGYHKQGGWCVPGGDTFIPNRNIQIVNNVVFNPDGFESRFAHFGISGPKPAAANSNVPDPICTTELRIEGNVIWNGGPGKPVLDDVENEYGLAAKPTFSVEDLRRNNHLNTLRPELIDAAGGNFHPRAEGNLIGIKLVKIHDFSADDPHHPPGPVGELDNAILTDRSGKDRRGGCIGAFTA